MTYDFDTPIDRRGTYALKWENAGGALPMWVADMDLRCAPEIIDALQTRVRHGIFGYSIIPDEWYDAYIGWWRDRHGFTMQRDWLVFTTGVVPAISSVVRRLTLPAENVLTLTPCYNIFFNSIVNNGRRVLECPLDYDGRDYSICWCRLERMLAMPQTTMMILCNPHNPIGRIWDKATLARIGEMCARHGVVVLSDEIHCDITDPGKEYVPFASASAICRDNSVMAIAPTKTFNLAGLQTAAVAIPNERLRHRVERGLNNDEIAEPNSFAILAAITAYTQGADWLDALRPFIAENKRIAARHIAADAAANHGCRLYTPPSEATYLVWIDCTAIVGQESTDGMDTSSNTGASGITGASNSTNTSGSTDELCRHLKTDSGLWLSEGSQYGGNGRRFVRMNVACPRSRLLEGLGRLSRGVRSYRASHDSGIQPRRDHESH